MGSLSIGGRGGGLCPGEGSLYGGLSPAVHLVAATAAGGTHPTGMHSCFGIV